MTIYKQISFKSWAVLFGCSLMLLLVNLDVTIVNLGLAAMNKDFQQRLTTLQWVISSYALSAAIGFIIISHFTNQQNLKRVFMLGILSFVCGSLLCGFAHYFTLLIIGRIIQGIGLAATLNIALLIVKCEFNESLQGFAIGCCTIMTGVALAFGPSLGGIIIHLANWRWLFFINLPIALLSFMTVLIFVDEKINIEKPHRQSITQIFSLIKNNSYMINLVIRAITMIVWSSLLFCIPLYLQNIMGLSSVETGYIMFTMMILFAVSSPSCGRIIDRHQAALPMFYASVFGVIIMLALIVTLETNVYLLLLPLLFVGVIIALLVVGTIHQAYRVLPINHLAQGMGYFFAVAFLSVMLGVFMTTSLFRTLPTLFLQDTLHHVLSNYSISHSLSKELIHCPELLEKAQIVYKHVLQLIFLVNGFLLMLAAYCAKKIAQTETKTDHIK